MRMIKAAWYVNYRLEPLHHVELLKSRQGALLKIEFTDEMVGYADCHPWESCGDSSLQEQLNYFTTKSYSPLMQRTLFFARLDAKARYEMRPLLDKETNISNHWLDVYGNTNFHQCFEEGFNRFKIKGVPTRKTLDGLPDSCKVRLDFNSQMNKNEFESFLCDYKYHLEKIDFIEDPFPYHDDAWNDIQDRYEVTLACDRFAHQAIEKEKSAKVLVVKPAILALEKTSPAQRAVVTSYLDHPLGQACAAYVAQSLNIKDCCGLNSHRVYQPTPFSELLQQKGPLFKPAPGFGFGFDDLLKKQKWVKCIF